MFNNPFRGKPIPKAQRIVEEWGKVKFKPSKFDSGRKRDFNKNKDSSSKFNQVAKGAKPENATPWNKYKDEIVFKQREEEQAALQANMDSEEGKQALKERENIYRKLLIEQKKQEPTQWENFSDEDDKDVSKKKNKKSSKEINSTAKRKKAKITNTKNISELDPKSKIDFKKNNSNSQRKGEVKQLISQELLNNFDSKKLNFKQNDMMRKIITKTTVMSYGSSLRMTINDMKHKKEKNKNK